MHHHQTNFSYLLTVRWTIDLCFTNIFLYLLANSWPNTLLVTLKFILMIRWQQFALIFSDCQRNIPLFLWFAVIFFTLLILLPHINNDFFHFKGNPFVCLLDSDILRMVTPYVIFLVFLPSLMHIHEAIAFLLRIVWKSWILRTK